MMSILEKIEDVCAGFNGRIGLSVLNLQTNEEIHHHSDDTFPTASVIKLPVLVTLMAQVEAGQYTLDEPLMLRRSDKIGGSGLLQHLTPGIIMPIRDWALMMMNISDNTATNVLIDHVGKENVGSWLTENEYSDIQLHNKIDFPALGQDVYHFGSATPHCLTRLMTAVFQHHILSPDACAEMLRMMDKVGSDRIGRYLPFEPFDADIPPSQKLRLAGKTGSFKGCRAQTAVVWRGDGEDRRGFVITVMTEGDPAPETWSKDAAGVLVIGRLARVIYDDVFDG